MTPAIKTLEQAEIPFTLHPYDHSEDAESYGEEAAQKLGVEPSSMFKTLVVQTEDRQLYLALVPVGMRLNLKALRDFLGAGKVEMADPGVAERATGYVVGGISPLGGRRKLPVVIDETVILLEQLYFSAGRRGLQVQMAAEDFLRLTEARVGAIAVEG